MNITSNVLSEVKKFLNLQPDDPTFDGEIIPHVMLSIGRLSQNGVGRPTVIASDTTWTDVIDKEMIVNPEVFSMLPMYVMLSTRMLFDPPPPSMLQYYQSNLDDTLWRLRLIYDTREVI